MSTLACSWRRVELPPAHREALRRSSQSLAVAGGRAYLFGGERQPRTPVDDVLYEIDLESGAVEAHSAGPTARVGAGLAAVGEALFLWGGRGGKAMQPLPATLHRFDLQTKRWTDVAAASSSDVPAERSYHVLVAAGDALYAHAGCPAKGRSASLASFSPADGRWRALPDAPAEPRGGTALAALADGRLARFGGFAGRELAGPLHVYDPRRAEWSEAAVRLGAEPPARSVHGFVGLRTPLALDDEARAVAVLLYGEAGPAPADLGHDGAGQFHDDVWALVEHADGAFEWRALPPPDARPSPRGWLAVAPWHRADGTTAVVLHGGLEATNERLGDLWVLDLR